MPLPASASTIDVFEVDVDKPRDVDGVADAAHRVLQHVVGVRERLFLGHVVAHSFEQLLVQHHDQSEARS